MKVVLTEKPSVARELAAHLGARARRDGYFEGGGYQVTWALGHLVGLCEPHEYDAALRRWDLQTLPILPKPFKLALTGDARSKAQYKIVAALLRKATTVICATDAGREGELIFRNIAQLSRTKGKPTQRLWLSSLTPSAIASAFSKLKPAKAYDRLAAAAQCRSQADWLVGLNATRNYTVRHGEGGVLWSVGRVQTPVLALIAERDDEIVEFVSVPWFELRTKYRDALFISTGKRFETQAAADEVARQLIEDTGRQEAVLAGTRDRLALAASRQQLLEEQVEAAWGEFSRGRLEYQDWAQHYALYQSTRTEIVALQLQHDQARLSLAALRGALPQVCR